MVGIVQKLLNLPAFLLGIFFLYWSLPLAALMNKVKFLKMAGKRNDAYGWCGPPRFFCPFCSSLSSRPFLSFRARCHTRQSSGHQTSCSGSLRMCASAPCMHGRFIDGCLACAGASRCSNCSG